MEEILKILIWIKNLSKIEHLDISYGIPLYSDLAEEHDFITGVKGSFQQTIKGLYNLAQYKQKIEIRIVILKQNYRKLKDIAEYIYRNLPFVTHIALMGMEYHGRAETNYEDINIDPYDYKEELYEAIRQFVRYNITADVYNIPLCLADNRIEEFCRDSISSWKKAFLDKCSNCRKRELCSGIFETSFTQSKYIHPFL